jgi:hypothetical protein
MYEQVGLFDPVNPAPRDIRRLQLLYLDPVALANTSRVSAGAREITGDHNFISEYIDRQGIDSVTHAVENAIRDNNIVTIMFWWDHLTDRLLDRHADPDDTQRDLTFPTPMANLFVAAAVESNNSTILRKMRALIGEFNLSDSILLAGNSVLNSANPKTQADWDKIVLYQNALYPSHDDFTARVIDRLALSQEGDTKGFTTALVRLATKSTLLSVFRSNTPRPGFPAMLDALGQRLYNTSPARLMNVIMSLNQASLGRAIGPFLDNADFMDQLIANTDWRFWSRLAAVIGMRHIRINVMLAERGIEAPFDRIIQNAKALKSVKYTDPGAHSDNIFDHLLYVFAAGERARDLDADVRDITLILKQGYPTRQGKRAASEAASKAGRPSVAKLIATPFPSLVLAEAAKGHETL